MVSAMALGLTAPAWAEPSAASMAHEAQDSAQDDAERGKAVMSAARQLAVEAATQGAAAIALHASGWRVVVGERVSVERGGWVIRADEVEQALDGAALTLSGEVILSAPGYGAEAEAARCDQEGVTLSQAWLIRTGMHQEEAIAVERVRDTRLGGGRLELKGVEVKGSEQSSLKESSL